MKTKFILISCFLFLFVGAPAPAFAQQLSTFVHEKLLGYKDRRGRVVIPARFTMAGDFSKEGLAIVIDQEGWALINRKGLIVIRTPFIFDGGPDDFAEGLARFTAGGKFGFYDKTGRTIVRPQFDFALPFQEGAAAVCLGCRKTSTGKEDEHYFVTGGRWGFINRRSAVIIPLRYDEAGSFARGRALVKLNGQQFRIDIRGRISTRAARSSR